jgi:hypothetical protein
MARRIKSGSAAMFSWPGGSACRSIIFTAPTGSTSSSIDGGCEAALHRDLARHALSAADALMRAVPSYDEWSNLAVYVYDERGQVDILPFPEPLRQAA